MKYTLRIYHYLTHCDGTSEWHCADVKTGTIDKLQEEFKFVFNGDRYYYRGAYLDQDDPFDLETFMPDLLEVFT